MWGRQGPKYHTAGVVRSIGMGCDRFMTAHHTPSGQRLGASTDLRPLTVHACGVPRACGPQIVCLSTQVWLRTAAGTVLLSLRPGWDPVLGGGGGGCAHKLQALGLGILSVSDVRMYVHIQHMCAGMCRYVHIQHVQTWVC